MVPFSVHLALILFSLSMSYRTGFAVSAHDPHIIKCRDYYYVFATGRWRNVIQTIRSQNLIDWQPAGTVFESSS